jgi:archaemetzincin
MMPEEVGLIQVGPTLDCSLHELGELLSGKFPWFEMRELPSIIDPNEAYDSSRSQHHSTRILAMLEPIIHDLNLQRLLGLTALDLYVPGMNFVFGEARLPGKVGVVSTYRLKSSKSERILEDRVLKEAMHEIGHTLGLKHCPNGSCVMYFSERLSDTDRKLAEFCDTCRPKVERIRVE